MKSKEMARRPSSFLGTSSKNAFWYIFALSIDDGEHSWWTWLTPELTYNYDLYDAATRPQEEIDLIEQMLVEHHDEIVSLFNTVKNVWGIEFLTVK